MTHGLPCGRGVVGHTASPGSGWHGAGHQEKQVALVWAEMGWAWFGMNVWVESDFGL